MLRRDHAQQKTESYAASPHRNWPGCGTITICPIRAGMGSMEAKIFLMFALLAPVLMLAAGIFAHRQNTRAEMGNGK
jgi:hypothetical protein